jgi:hypothetical protein
MLRPILATVAIAIGITAAPALSQPQPPAAEEQVNLVGLSVYSSDGEKLGEVLKVGYAKGRRALQAELGALLGLGPTPVVIPGDLFEYKGDRIEVSMTAAAVRESLAKYDSK